MWDQMLDLLSMPTVQAVLGIVVLCILIAAGFWLVSIFRDRAAGDGQVPVDTLAKFEEMYLEGDISESEFRTIKASLARRRDTPVEEEGASA